MEVLQINCNHSQVSQDLVIQYMLESRIRICALAEPYKTQGAGIWAVSADNTCAVLLLPGKPYHKWHMIKQGIGFVIVEIDGIVVISSYFSPNIRYGEFAYLLSELKIELRKYANDKVILLGDFNARSTVWGDKLNTRRGDDIYDMTGALGFVFCNNIGTCTCITVQGNSISDLAFVSRSLGNSSVNWMTCDVEVWSDHVPIKLTIKNVNRCDINICPQVSIHSWSVKRFDGDLFRRILITDAWCHVICTNLQITAGNLNYDNLTCDQAAGIFFKQNYEYM